MELAGRQRSETRVRDRVACLCGSPGPRWDSQFSVTDDIWRRFGPRQLLPNIGPGLAPPGPPVRNTDSWAHCTLIRSDSLGLESWDLRFKEGLQIMVQSQRLQMICLE